MDAVWSVFTVRPINSSYALTVLAHELMGLLMGYPIGGMDEACMCTRDTPYGVSLVHMGYPIWGIPCSVHGHRDDASSHCTS